MDEGTQTERMEVLNMAKISRGGRMTAAKRRAANSHHGGKGLVKNRPAGRNIMRT
jgi:hypothetical protein